MNCPSRTDEPPASDGLNQSPNALSNDLTTNQDLKGLANARRLQQSTPPPIESAGLAGSSHRGGIVVEGGDDADRRPTAAAKEPTTTRVDSVGPAGSPDPAGGLARPSQVSVRPANGSGGALRTGGGDDGTPARKGAFWAVVSSLETFYRFIGPGFIVAVAYIDPGNYATDIAAGASYRFRLLFVVLLSNIFAIFLQSISIKLGTVSGRNLADACRTFLPRWLNLSLYVLAEVAIIATDIAEVIGTAIALNLLQPKIPLVAGCAISICDVLVVLVFCKPENGTRSGLRAFEFIVMPLVIGVVVCFCIQLSLIGHSASVGEVFRGYLPSSALIEQKGLYQACGILGATVMPHSLYLGSGIVQARLREYDEKRGLLPPQMRPEAAERASDGDGEGNDNDYHRAPVGGQNSSSAGILSVPFMVARRATRSVHRFFRLQFSSPGIQFDDTQTFTYIPSLRAVRHCYKYSVIELGISLFTFALFVNSAILVVAGAALYQNTDALGADIFAIHALLSKTISPGAGTIFALALLLSGLSAGVVCTVAGQLVCEGALQWKMAPWLRRLLTRSISITPSIIIAGAVGREGLDDALNATQVILSVVLPFVTAPLLWFTTFNKYMTIQPGNARYTLRARYRKGVSGSSDEGIGGAVADGEEADEVARQVPVSMANSWPVALMGLLIWIIITAMNVANLVLLGLGN